MTKRIERVQRQADLKKLQSYKSNLDIFEANLQNRTSELSDELETTGKYNRVSQPVLWQDALDPVGI